MRTEDVKTTMQPAVKRGIHPALLSLCFLLAGCVSTQFPSAGEQTVAIDTRDGVLAQADVEPLIRSELDRWEGTPHVLGGSTASGMDCSAFVQRVFADAFRLDLPRVTEDQVDVGRRVNMSELQAGDLVFFQPPTKTNHVGIYLNEGEFAHVSSSDGVSIAELDQPYWRTSYWTSRRVLPENGSVAAPEPDAEQVVERSDRIDPRGDVRRVGW